MNIEYQYNKDWAGAKALAIKNGAQICTSFQNSGVFWNVNKGTYYILTGYYHLPENSNAAFLQTTVGGFIIIGDLDNPEWSFTTGFEKVQTYSTDSAQKIVDRLIKNNQTIIANNLLCARFIHKLTSAQKKQLYDLQERLELRNNTLINDGFVTISKTGVPAGYAELQKYLDTFMQSGGIGSVTVAIVIAAVVVASLSTAAYFAYSYYYKQSEEDVKFSNELTKTLTSKLTDAEYKQLLEETKGIVTRAKIKANFSGSKSMLLLGLGMLAAGYLAYKYNK